MLTTRYARQSILPEIGPHGQAALARARVLVVGAGGLGSPALLYLAAAGVGLRSTNGCLGLIDDDRVSLDNLQRQILFNEADVGQPKTGAAAARLRALNQDINLVVHHERLTRDNVLERFADYDIIVDGTDNFASKYLINDAAVKLGLPVVYGAVLGLEGQLAVFWARHGPCYRCLYPHAPTTPVMNCAEAGTLGGLAGVIGAMQAVEACKLALGLEHCAAHGLEPLIGQLWTASAHDWATQRRAIAKNPACPVCSLPLAEITFAENDMTCALDKTDAALQSMTLTELANLLEAGIPLTLLDVRETDEWASGHLAGAQHLPLGTLLATDNAALDELPTDQPIVVYCQHGLRSQTAVAHLRRQGFDAFTLQVDWSQITPSATGESP